jgi:hypothetical protein
MPEPFPDLHDCAVGTERNEKDYSFWTKKI